MSNPSDIVIEPAKNTVLGGLHGAKWGGLAGFIAGAVVVGAAAALVGAGIGLLAAPFVGVMAIGMGALGLGALGALAGGISTGVGGAYTGGSWGLIGGAILGLTKGIHAAGETVGGWFGAKKQAQAQQEIDAMQSIEAEVSAKERAAKLHLARAQNIAATGGTPDAQPDFVAGLTNKQSGLSPQVGS